MSIRRRPLENITLARNAGAIVLIRNTCKNVAAEGGTLYRRRLVIQGHAAVTSAGRRIAARGRGEAFGLTYLLLRRQREKVTATAHGVILQLAEQHARVTPPDIQGGTYSFGAHGATWRAGHQLSRHVPGTCEHVAALTSGLFIPTSLVYEDRLPAGFVADFRGPPVNWE